MTATASTSSNHTGKRTSLVVDLVIVTMAAGLCISSRRNVSIQCSKSWMKAVSNVGIHLVLFSPISRTAVTLTPLVG